MGNLVVVPVLVSAKNLFVVDPARSGCSLPGRYGDIVYEMVVVGPTAMRSAS
jgi:hypothetical protein